jgi:cation diffusion facilitator family transporter
VAVFLKSAQGASLIAIIATAILFTLKLVVSLVTGSVSIRADAIHSIIDFTGALIGMIGIKVASKPPDGDHAYGHGKAENLAGAIIGVLILTAAVTIAYEAISRLIDQAAMELVAIGIYTTLVAIVINLAVSYYGLRISKNTGSVALEATSHDLLADSMSSLAVLAGLVLVAITKIYVFDAVVALLVAALIMRTAIKTLVSSFGGLMDRRLPGEEEEIIKSCLKERADIIGYHKLRTRKSGCQRQIDVHLVLPEHYTLAQAHRICDEAEAEIEKRLPGSHVTIHTEPSLLK